MTPFWILLCLLVIGTPAWAIDQAIPVVLQDAAAATGDGTTMPVSGFSTMGVQTVISATATVTFEVTIDGTNWATVLCTDTAGSSGTTSTSSGIYRCPVAGYNLFRARVSSFGSGTVTAKGLATTATSGGSSGSGGGDASAANQSTMITALQLIDNDQTGASVHYRTSAGSTEDEHEIKATAGRLFSITATNTNAAARYLKCSNLTAANTTPGTSTVFLGLAIPGATAGAGFTVNFGPKGIAFSTALTCYLVTGAADNDVAEVAANEIKVIYAFE